MVSCTCVIKATLEFKFIRMYMFYAMVYGRSGRHLLFCNNAVLTFGITCIIIIILVLAVVVVL